MDNQKLFFTSRKVCAISLFDGQYEKATVLKLLVK